MKGKKSISNLLYTISSLNLVVRKKKEHVGFPVSDHSRVWIIMTSGRNVEVRGTEGV